MKTAQKKGLTPIIGATLTIIIGILFVANPLFPEIAVATVLGGLTILVGIINLIMFFTNSKGEQIASANLIIAAMLIVLGIFTLTHTNTLINIITYALSLYLIGYGAKNIEYALIFRKNSSSGGFFFSLLSAILIVAIGVLTLFLQDFMLKTFGLVLGIVLIVVGLIGMIISLRISKYTKTTVASESDYRDVTDLTSGNK